MGIMTRLPKNLFKQGTGEVGCCVSSCAWIHCGPDLIWLIVDLAKVGLAQWDALPREFRVLQGGAPWFLRWLVTLLNLHSWHFLPPSVPHNSHVQVLVLLKKWTLVFVNAVHFVGWGLIFLFEYLLQGDMKEIQLDFIVLKSSELWLRCFWNEKNKKEKKDVAIHNLEIVVIIIIIILNWKILSGQHWK